MWELKIRSISNGYILFIPKEDEHTTDREVVIEEDESDGLEAQESLLWAIMEYFNIGGSKHDKERLRVVRQKKEE